jgi:CSLREA domain-containing protein
VLARRLIGTAGVGALALCFALALPGSARAAVLTVTTTTDSNDGSCTVSLCSLRDAIDYSFAGDAVAVPAGTYTLTLGELEITHDLTLAGPAASTTIVDANQGSRVFAVDSGANVSLSGLTITGGFVAGNGGGILSDGNLTLSDDVVTANTADSASGGSPEGGGIAESGTGTLSVALTQITNNVARSDAGVGTPQGGGIFDNSPGALTLTSSVLSGNSAHTASTGLPDGGGLAGVGADVTITGTTIEGNAASLPASGAPLGGGIFMNGSSLSVSASTISGNTASGTGGVGAGGGIYAKSVALTLTNATVTGNGASSGTNYGGGLYLTSSAGGTILNSTVDANSASGGQGGNLYAVSSPLGVENSIVSDGAAATGPDCAVSSGGTITSQGHNIETGADCGFTASGDLQSTDPKLGPLQDNGGGPQTQAFPNGSPAVDAAAAGDCPATDERQVVRPQGAGCDIGALEAEAPSVTDEAASAVTPVSATVGGTLTSNALVVGASTYAFEYGTSTSYGSSTPVATTAATAAATPVTADLSGLAPATTYHFRLDVTNSEGGTTLGPDATFTTPAAVPGVTTSGRVSVHRSGRTYTVSPGIEVSCPAWASSCAMTVSARAAHRSAGTASVTIASGQSRAASLRLARAAARKLRAKGRLRLQFTVVAGADSYPAVTTTKTVVAKVRRHKR